MTTNTPQGAPISSTREAFEEFFSASRNEKRPDRVATRFDRMEGGDYVHDHTQRHWWTWQNAILVDRAQRAATPTPAVDAVPGEPEFCPYCDGSGESIGMEGEGPDRWEVPIVCPQCDGKQTLRAAYDKLAAELPPLQLKATQLGIFHSHATRYGWAPNQTDGMQSFAKLAAEWLAENATPTAPQAVGEVVPYSVLATNYAIQKRERERLEIELRNCESRIREQRAEINRLAAPVAPRAGEEVAADIRCSTCGGRDIPSGYGKCHCFKSTKGNDGREQYGADAQSASEVGRADAGTGCGSPGAGANLGDEHRSATTEDQRHAGYSLGESVRLPDRRSIQEAIDLTPEPEPRDPYAGPTFSTHPASAKGEEPTPAPEAKPETVTQDTRRLDWMERDMLLSEPTCIEWADGAFTFPYLVSAAGGFVGGVGHARFKSLREAIDAALATNQDTKQ